MKGFTSSWAASMVSRVGMVPVTEVEFRKFGTNKQKKGPSFTDGPSLITFQSILLTSVWRVKVEELVEFRSDDDLRTMVQAAVWR